MHEDGGQRASSVIDEFKEQIDKRGLVDPMTGKTIRWKRKRNEEDDDSNEETPCCASLVELGDME